MAVALQHQARRAGAGEGQPLLLGERAVEVGEVAADFRQVDRLEGGALAAGLGAGDAEQRIEALDHGVGIAQGLLEQRARLGAIGIGQQCYLDARAHPAERRAQVVRDVVGDLAHARQQALDLVEHGVQVAGEHVELVARALERDPLAEVAGHDPPRGAVDRIDPAQHAAAHHEAAGQAQQQGQADAPADRLLASATGSAEVLDVAADQETEVAGEREAGRAHDDP